MAPLLSEVQVAGLADAARALHAEIAKPSEMRGLVDALRSSEGARSAFSDEDFASMEAGVSMLSQPLEERAPWKAAKGRGLFFVFEGLDRSGKSTQSRKLRERLQKEQGEDKVKWMCFPNRDTAIGCLIDLYLRRQIELSDGAIHLLFSANRWEMSKTIVDELNAGVSVVCDRYAFSGVAYSAAKGLDFEWCQAPDRGLPCPDGVFFMRVDPEVGAARANFGDERYENADMQARVREEFGKERLYAGVPWHVVDGGRAIDLIHDEIVKQVAAIAVAEQENDSKPIRQLWMPSV